MVEVTLYVVFCILTGLCGINRRMGFFGTFVIALVTGIIVPARLAISALPRFSENCTS